MSKIVRVRFGYGLRGDWEGRDIYSFAWDPGVLELNAEQVDDLLGDLRHYSSPSSTDMDPGIRQLYVRGLATLLKAIEKGKDNA